MRDPYDLNQSLWVLQRRDNSVHGMFGELYHPTGGVWCETLELPWRDNMPLYSCIPTGTYTVIWSRSPRFKRNMYLIDKVPGRSGIRIHAGSFAGAKDLGFKTDFDGCLSFGTNTTYLHGQRILQNTVRTVTRFEELMEGRPFYLQIVGKFPSIPFS